MKKAKNLQEEKAEDDGSLLSETESKITKAGKLVDLVVAGNV